MFKKEVNMASNKRILLATLFGVISGLLCYSGARIIGIEMGLDDFMMILFHRALLGFVIGISSLRWHWAWHGILLGLIIGIPNPHFFEMLNGVLSCGIYFFMGAVWGFLIELFTSVVFNKKSSHK
jgi:hypothetical protein